jgi:hypothetical protein
LILFLISSSRAYRSPGKRALAFECLNTFLETRMNTGAFEPFEINPVFSIEPEAPN